MSDREQLIKNITRWVQIGDDMKNYRKELKTLRQEKKDITNALVEVMKTNDIDCFDIKNGQLLYTKNKTKKPLSKKHLLESLIKYFSNDKDMAADVSKYIMNSREEKVNESIKMKIKKS
jgi:hypothetical protein